MSTELAFCVPYERNIKSFGALRTPIFLITFRGKEKEQVVKAEMIFDTGSDVTLVPRIVADVLNIDLKTGIVVRLMSIDGESQAYVHIFNLTFGSILLGKVPIAISERDDIPFLLGSLGVIGKMPIELGKEEMCFGKP